MDHKMVPPLSALSIMVPLSLPNQREPCKVEKIVLVPPKKHFCDTGCHFYGFMSRNFTMISCIGTLLKSTFESEYRQKNNESEYYPCCLFFATLRSTFESEYRHESEYYPCCLFFCHP